VDKTQLPTKEEDAKALVLVLGKMFAKARPMFAEDKPIGYRVPLREFTRARAKYYRLQAAAKGGSQ